MKDLLRAGDLTPDDMAYLLDLAADLRRDPFRASDHLAGEMVVLCFSQPSTRTRLSFSAAAGRLGATVVMVGPSELQLGRGETIEDTARVMSSYARALVVRTHADDDLRRLAGASEVPVVNALTDGHHPCQSIADLMTLREHFSSLEGLRIAYVGAGNNVAHSLMEACALTGVDIAVATPPDLHPDAQIVADAQRLAARSGSRVDLVVDPYEAVDGVDAIYTDVWLSMGDPEGGREARRDALRPYQVNSDLMARAADHAVFLHCLPAHRDDEVTAEVMASPRSLVFEQAANRLHTAGAILFGLTTGSINGAVPVLAAQHA